MTDFEGQYCGRETKKGKTSREAEILNTIKELQFYK